MLEIMATTAAIQNIPVSTLQIWVRFFLNTQNKLVFFKQSFKLNFSAFNSLLRNYNRRGTTNVHFQHTSLEERADCKEESDGRYAVDHQHKEE
jgi:hypothetical protein